MAHLLNLIEATGLTPFTGSAITTLDFTPSGALTTYQFLLHPDGFTPGEPQFKETWINNPQGDGRSLSAWYYDTTTEVIEFDIIATGANLAAKMNNLLAAKDALDLFFKRCRDSQIYRSGGGFPWYWRAYRPLNSSTKTLKRQIFSGRCIWGTHVDTDLVTARVNNCRIEMVVDSYDTGSTITVLSSTAADNGKGNYVSFAADTANYVQGSSDAPLTIEVDGGNAATTQIIAALRYRGTPANFKHVYWAKDATRGATTANFTGNYTVTNAALTSNVATLTIGTHSHVAGDLVTVSSVSLDGAFNGTYTVTSVGATTISYALTHADIGSAASTGTVTGEIDGNGTGNGTRTTATNTSETLALTWTNTTNPSDQVGNFRGYLRCRESADRYTVRVRQFLYDGTNKIYPDDGGYATIDAQSVGTSSGNGWSWVDIGGLKQPVLELNGAAPYGVGYDIYVTCSDTTGNPTLDIDGLWLVPVGEGGNDTGFFQATHRLAFAAAGVDTVFIDATPAKPPSYLADASDNVTFPAKNYDAGYPLFAIPQKLARLYVLLIDGTNLRHDYTLPLTVNVTHELRVAGGAGS